MAMSSYGFQTAVQPLTDIETYLEEINLNGYTILPAVFSADELNILRAKIIHIYTQQEQRTGRDFLKEIGDEHICRCPMAYDADFLRYAQTNIFMQIAEHFLDNYFILSVQNANLSKPAQQHVQSSWHRDLPYQNFTSSMPLGLNFLVAVDDFTIENGGVVVLPYSHKMESLPSQHYLQKHALTITAKAGDVIAFNSMLIHKAGTNRSANERLSFNHMYTRPFIKQQYDYATIINTIPNIDERAHRLSGITSRTAADDMDWRQIRHDKMK